jgi:hypothetical protein
LFSRVAQLALDYALLSGGHYFESPILFPLCEHVKKKKKKKKERKTSCTLFFVLREKKNINHFQKTKLIRPFMSCLLILGI